MIKRSLIIFAIVLIALLVIAVFGTVWLFEKMDADTRRTYKGFDEREISDVIDYKALQIFLGIGEGSAAPISKYIRKQNITTICLDQPYGLPEEKLSMNGLPEPDDGVSYMSFFIEGGEYYYALPLGRGYHIPSRECAQPTSILVSYPCVVRTFSKICLKWK